MNRIKRILLLTVFSFFNILIYAQTADAKFKVVIDAGHGGEDPGCLGKKSKEKDVNLAVALRVGKMISENYDDVQVIFTRKTDVFVEVYKRAVIANNNHANLFISIHCNAAEDHSAGGIETYVMGIEKTTANQAVAKKENAAILLEKNYENNYEGFNPNSPESDIAFSLYTSAFLKNSILLADKVQKNLVMHTNLVDRKVQQAGFWVLYKVAMPSILIELGFLSNAKEEEFLIKESTKEIMATSIYNAFVSYKNNLTGDHKKGIEVPKKSEAPETVKIEEKETVLPKQEPTAAAGVTKAPLPADTVKATISDISTSKETATTKTPPPDNSLQIRFRVQIAAIPESISTHDARFQSVNNVKKYYENKLWKYTAGDEPTFAEAQALLKTVKTKFPDAFIIAFKNETKISVPEARKQTENR